MWAWFQTGFRLIIEELEMVLNERLEDFHHIQETTEEHLTCVN